MKPFFVRVYGGKPSEISTLPVSFESFAETMSLLPGLYFEMDGSFVWVGNADSNAIEATSQRAWQLDGMVYDLGETIQYIELKGNCSREAWTQLMKACAGDSAIIHRVDIERWVSREEFEQDIFGRG